MKLNPIGAHEVEVVTEKATILFSYKTPVAACLSDVVDGIGPGFVRTNKKWSVTTSKHINKWLEGARAKEVPQEFLDKLAG